MDSGIMARHEVVKLKIRFWPATTKRRGGSTGCGLSLGGERLLTRG